MKPLLDIIIPTFNNPQYFNPCVDSIIKTGILTGLARLIIVNNGQQPIEATHKNVIVLKPKKNLGWEGGLKLALEHSSTPFVCFQNDDTHIPKANRLMYQFLLSAFSNPEIAAVAPVTTTAAGMQSIFYPQCPNGRTEVSYLIFYCVMLRRKYIDEAGGIDTTLPGGDDIDLSIRLRKLGKSLIIEPNTFLIHHGFKTGTRVHGDGYAGVKGGWNSQEMIERTQHALIRKHGFKEWFTTVAGLDYSNSSNEPIDYEGDKIKPLIKGEKILELGCGSKKTVPQAIGVDKYTKGEDGEFYTSGIYNTDIVADITKPLPFRELSQDTIIARHVLEHFVNSFEVLEQWNNVLQMDGRLIIALPNEEMTSGIPLHPEHVHAFTPSFLKRLVELCGFELVDMIELAQTQSLVGCFKKVKHIPLKTKEPVHA